MFAKCFLVVTGLWLGLATVAAASYGLLAAYVVIDRHVHPPLTPEQRFELFLESAPLCKLTPDECRRCL